MLTVGIPKEIIPLEKRVGLTPAAVRELCGQGIAVKIETLAGAASQYADEDYRAAGAEILPNAAALYKEADLIVKVKEPLAAEFPLMKERHIFFCFLHLASPNQCDLVNALIQSRATAIGFETVEEGGTFPLLAPMSEIAGALGAAYALRMQALMRRPPIPLPLEGGEGNIPMQGGRGTDLLREFETLAAQYPNFSSLESDRHHGACHSVNLVIFGGGVAGFSALQAAQQSQTRILVTEKDPPRREFLKRFTRDVFDPAQLPLAVLENADLLIGCVHSRGERAVQVLDEKKFRQISQKKNKIVVDIAIDQGGNFPESRATSYQNPVYFDSLKNLRFGVANIPSLCGRGASEKLSQAGLPYVTALARDPEAAFKKCPELKEAVNIQGGKVLIPAIQLAHRRE